MIAALEVVWLNRWYYIIIVIDIISHHRLTGTVEGSPNCAKTKLQLLWNSTTVTSQTSLSMGTSWWCYVHVHIHVWRYLVCKPYNHLHKHETPASLLWTQECSHHLDYRTGRETWYFTLFINYSISRRRAARTFEMCSEIGDMSGFGMRKHPEWSLSGL